MRKRGRGETVGRIDIAHFLCGQMGGGRSLRMIHLARFLVSLLKKA